MSMGDVKRFRKEVVDSIGTGTASPVRAVFSSTIADGDTFLMGEMAGVDEGLVIQELSRADELVKLQHELEKQVGKLAELEELKWLGELEKLQAEEIQKVKGRIGEMEKEKIEEVKELHQQSVPILSGREKLRGKLEEFERSKQLEAIKDLGGLVKELEKLKGATTLQGQVDQVKELKDKLEELAAIQGLKGGVERLKETGELEKVKEPGDLEQLETEKIEEVEAARKAVVTILGEKFQELGDLEQLEALQSWGKVKEVKDRIGEMVKAREVLEKLKVEELATAEKVRQEIGELEKIKEVERGLETGLTELEKTWLFKNLELVKVNWKHQGQLEGVKWLETLKKLKLEGLKEKLKGGETKTKIQKLKSELEELAAIKELKELGLEERLRELAEVKEVKALAEKQQLQGLDAQEGLQLTEKIRELQESLVRLAGRKLEELTQWDEQGIRKNLNPQAIKTVAERVEEIRVLRTLGQLDDLMPGERLRELAEVKETLKQLKEMKIEEVKEARKEVVTTLGLNEEEIKKGLEKLEAAKKNWEKVQAAMGQTAKRVIAELEKEMKGLKSLGEQELVKLTAEEVEAKVKEVRELVQLEKNHWLRHLKKTELEGLKKKLETIKELKVEKLTEGLQELTKIKALEELTEIAEKRGVATVMKAALTSAMEITKNRGWTDYLKRVDSDKRDGASTYQTQHPSTYHPLLLTSTTAFPYQLHPVPNSYHPAQQTTQPPHLRT